MGYFWSWHRSLSAAQSSAGASRETRQDLRDIAGGHLLHPPSASKLSCIIPTFVFQAFSKEDPTASSKTCSSIQITSPMEHFSRVCTEFPCCKPVIFAPTWEQIAHLLFKFSKYFLHFSPVDLTSYSVAHQPRCSFGENSFGPLKAEMQSHCKSCFRAKRLCLTTFWMGRLLKKDAPTSWFGSQPAEKTYILTDQSEKKFQIQIIITFSTKPSQNIWFQCHTVPIWKLCKQT